jgi:hypothetical protein
MARPRNSFAAARMSGALYKNPQRYRTRKEPLVTDPIGSPPAWLTDDQADAWNDFADRLPWLNRSHRGIVGIASVLQAKQANGELGVPGMNLLRLVLGQLCATPTTAGKVSMPEPVSDEAGELLD